MERLQSIHDITTPEQRENLRTLANYLLRRPLPAAFDARVYCAPGFFYNTETCGSVGCSIGHGPYAGIRKNADEDWLGYSNRVFAPYPSALWEWLFSEEWEEVDNTPQGAARRILLALEVGVPANAEQQRRGDALLSY